MVIGLHLRRRILAALALSCIMFNACTIAEAAKVFRWVDHNGVAHYGDHVPDSVDRADTPVTRLAITAEPAPIVKLLLEPSADHVDAWAENTLAGPIEVVLHTRDNAVIAADPQLPAHATLPAQQRIHIARLYTTTRTDLRLDVTLGDPNASPRDIEYLYPLQLSNVQVEQGYGGSYSHQDAQNHNAVDFAADIGTPVLAARAGTVMQIEADFDKAGLNAEKFAGRANFIRILHDDGTMALYAHLKSEGALVRLGQRVRRGQIIGLSGNTGFTSGPHLHFVVQLNRDMQLVSIPFRMFGPGGILRFSDASHDTAEPH